MEYNTVCLKDDALSAEACGHHLPELPKVFGNPKKKIKKYPKQIKNLGVRIFRTCPHKRLRRVAMLEIITMASSEATEIS